MIFLNLYQIKEVYM